MRKIFTARINCGEKLLCVLMVIFILIDGSNKRRSYKK